MGIFLFCLVWIFLTEVHDGGEKDTPTVWCPPWFVSGSQPLYPPCGCAFIIRTNVHTGEASHVLVNYANNSDLADLPERVSEIPTVGCDF